jgi:HTH-type transcriptional regulator/antitoxin HigA
VTIRPIRTDADYEAALDQARILITATEQRSIDDLEVLQALIERWERAHHSIETVTAAEALRFRMAQTGMKPRDLIPYLGTKSRVSEILSGERQPTVDQIRALHQHLGIPIASLVGPIKHEPVMRPSTASRAAVEKLKSLGVMQPREDLREFLARAVRIAPAVAMLRKTRTERTNAKTDFGALEAWCAAVLLEAESAQLPKTPNRTPSPEEARRLAQLSVLPDWPRRVRRALNEMGIVLVVLDHLPGTFLDGAAMRRSDGAPVIALTLRQDRLDNFWFTLLHELAHVCWHLGGETTVIFDDLDVNSSDGIEAEADDFARNALVPNDLWARRASADMGVDELLVLAMDAGVHPAVVAGRWRWENSDYRRFSRLLGRGEVRAPLGA